MQARFPQPASGKTQFSPCAREKWEKHVKLGSSAVGFAPSCVITSSSLCGGIHPALFLLGNIPRCCEEDDGRIKVSTVSLETAGRLQIFSQMLGAWNPTGSFKVVFLPVDSPYRPRRDLPAEAAMRTEGSGCRRAARTEGVGCSSDLGASRQIGRGLLVPDGDWEGCCQPLCRKARVWKQLSEMGSRAVPTSRARSNRR